MVDQDAAGESRSEPRQVARLRTLEEADHVERHAEPRDVAAQFLAGEIRVARVVGRERREARFALLAAQHGDRFAACLHRTLRHEVALGDEKRTALALLLRADEPSLAPAERVEPRVVGSGDG